MKILIPIMKFGKGGGFRVLSRLATEFIKFGHEVDIISTVYSSAPYFPTTASIYWSDLKGNLHNEPYSSARGWKPIFALYKGLRKISKNNYDIVLCNHSFTTFPVFFSKIYKLSSAFYYIQAYEPELYSKNVWVERIVLGWLCRLSYYFPFTQIVNADLYKDYKEIQTEKVVYPGLDLETYASKLLSGKPLKKKWIIGTVWRPEPIKGSKYIYEAFLRMSSEIPDMELVLAFGDTALHDPAKNIVVVQPNGDAHLSKFYRALDIYICAGTFQFGAIHYPVIESMACGTAVITTPYYPANDSNSWIIESRSVDSIIAAVKTVIGTSDNDIIKKKQSALESVKQFEWSKMAEKMIAYFKN